MHANEEPYKKFHSTFRYRGVPQSTFILEWLKLLTPGWKRQDTVWNNIHVHERVSHRSFEYTACPMPMPMPMTRDTNRSFGDRWSGASFMPCPLLHRYPPYRERDGEVGYYFLQIPLPCRSRWSCLADEWPRYPRDHWLVLPSLSWIIDQWTVSPAAKHPDATYFTSTLSDCPHLVKSSSSARLLGHPPLNLATQFSWATILLLDRFLEVCGVS